MPSTRSIARRAAALGASISPVALGALAASPAQAATCTVTPTTWPDLQAAFATAPASGGVICLGADITHACEGSPADPLISPAGSNITFDLNGHRLSAATTDGLTSIPGRAVIDVSTGRTLTIEATGGGSLAVYTDTGAAAIGGAQGEGAGTIIINGGTITASTGYDGPGIGGGQYGSGTGSVTINGGDVTAFTTNCGAGIGAADNASDPTNVTINGGKVTATGSCSAAGIGGSSDMVGAAFVTITAGTVVATSTQGAGIGGGRSGANVTISGGDVTASAAVNGVGTGAGAAIGTQWASGTAPGTLTLIGAGTPTPTSGANGAALSPTETVQPGPVGVTFTQTTRDGSATQGPWTRIVFTVAVAPQITTTSVVDGTVGTAYSQAIAASGTGPITFALAAGSTLPAGLSLDSTTGVISGTPAASGAFTFTITATNAIGTASRVYTMAVAAAPVTVAPSATPTTAAGAGSSKLAVTGMDGALAPVLVGGGVLLLAVGAGVVIRARRRHQS